MQRVCLISVITITLALSFLPAARAGNCVTPGVTGPACSYSATNGNCTLVIDRMNPVTPPTIYVRRGCSVTVKVINPTALEDLTLDWKSTATVIPPDTFQSAFSSLTTNLGKLTVLQLSPTAQGDVNLREEAPPPPPPTRCEDQITSDCYKDASLISQGQSRVLDNLKKVDPIASAQTPLQSIKDALQPLPSGIAAGTQPWQNTDKWAATVIRQLNTAIQSTPDYSQNIKILAKEISLFKQSHKAQDDEAAYADSKDAAAQLDKNQTALDTAYASVGSSIDKLKVLLAAVTALPAQGAGINGNAVINDTPIDAKNYQMQTWSLDYTNKLFLPAKRAAADALKGESATLLSGLADAPAKQPILTITVQFQTPSRVEASSGLMIPLRPFRSYAKASVAANGTVTNNVVQQTNTYAVVPMAFVNFLAKEWPTGQQRSAFFFTGGVGYNPATSAVEFGGGFTYSYRSLALSALVDIGRDTKLAGGFTIGESLGLANAASPLTSTFWAVKPAAAISVRIPLGGSSSSSSSSGH